MMASHGDIITLLKSAERMVNDLRAELVEARTTSFKGLTPIEAWDAFAEYYKDEWLKAAADRIAERK